MVITDILIKSTIASVVIGTQYLHTPHPPLLPFRFPFPCSQRTIYCSVLGVIVFILVLDIARTKYDDTFCCAWGSNGLHAVVMTFAFAWLGPWGSMAYVVCTSGAQLLSSPTIRLTKKTITKNFRYHGLCYSLCKGTKRMKSCWE